MFKKFGLFITFIASLSSVSMWPQIQARSSPNIVLITIDTLRADHLGCYGYHRNITPSLDQLALKGIHFENAFCVMPTTFPSHSSILFGTWPRVTGATSNFTYIQASSLPYLPHVMKQHGYSTAAFVSVHHLGMSLSALSGFDQLHFPDTEFSADVTLNAARKWLQINEKRKLFLWIHLFDAHSPYRLHAEVMKRINPRFNDNFPKRYGFMPSNFYSRENLNKMVDLYDNEIAYIDEQLSRFFNWLYSGSLAENTIILLAADHGETLDELAGTEYYAFDHGSFLYDDQIHVPLILVLADQHKTGLRISSPVSLIDIFPTILECANIKLPSPLSGESLLRYLYHDESDVAQELVFLQRRDHQFPPMPFLAQPQYGIREGNFKLISNRGDRQSLLLRNGEENIDLSQTHHLIKTRLSRDLENWLMQTSQYARQNGTDVPEEEAEKLRALGYIQ